jgi:ABC-type multidrug transport system permease subunit
MSGLLSAAGAICIRDLRLWLSYRTRAITTAFTAITSVILFYYVSRLVNSPEVGSPDDYFGFVVVGTVILGVMTSTLTTPVGTLRAELMTGTFERMVISPFGAVGSIISLTLFPALLGLAVGVITIGFAAIVFDLALTWPTALAALPVALLGVFSFVPFGILLAAVAMTFKQTNAGAAFVITGLSLAAGLYFPVSLLPEWIQWTADVQPMTPTADLMRHVLVGTEMSGSVLAAVLKLIGFALVMLPIATLVLRGSIERSRRKGTITEY